MPVLKSVNPYDPSRIVNYPQVTDMNLVVLLGRANKAFQSYKSSSFTERSNRMNKVASILLDRKREFAELITREMGTSHPTSHVPDAREDSEGGEVERGFDGVDSWEKQQEGWVWGTTVGRVKNGES